MFQVNFSKQSINELNKLDKIQQMQVVDKFSSLTPESIKSSEEVGKFTRNGKDFYRLKSGDFRIYFEIVGNTLYSHYMLHQHSLTDFIFRFKLPISEEQMVEQHQSFWKYLESLKK